MEGVRWESELSPDFVDGGDFVSFVKADGEEDGAVVEEDGDLLVATPSLSNSYNFAPTSTVSSLLNIELRYRLKDTLVRAYTCPKCCVTTPPLCALISIVTLSVSIDATTSPSFTDWPIFAAHSTIVP